MGRPHNRCRGFGRDERIRVPSPAASTTADSGRSGMRFSLSPDDGGDLTIHDDREHRPPPPHRSGGPVAMPVLKSSRRPWFRRLPAEPAGHGISPGRGGGRAGQGPGGWGRTLCGPPPGPGEVPGPGAHRTAPRRRRPLPGTGPSRGVGNRLHGGSQPGGRDRRGGAGSNAWCRPTTRPSAAAPPTPTPCGSRAGWPTSPWRTACRPSAWWNRGAPTCPPSPRSSSRGAGISRPHPTLGRRPSHHLPGLRQLDGRRGLRPRDERLHRDDRGSLQGLPGRSAPGQDGHRRGVRRRIAGRGRDARPGERAGRLPGHRRARRHPAGARHRGPPQLAQARPGPHHGGRRAAVRRR